MNYLSLYGRPIYAGWLDTLEILHVGALWKGISPPYIINFSTQFFLSKYRYDIFKRNALSHEAIFRTLFVLSCSPII